MTFDLNTKKANLNYWGGIQVFWNFGLVGKGQTHFFSLFWPKDPNDHDTPPLTLIWIEECDMNTEENYK